MKTTKEIKDQSFSTTFATMLLGVVGFQIGSYCGNLIFKKYYKHQIRNWINGNKKNIEIYNEYVINLNNTTSCPVILIPKDGDLSNMTTEQLLVIYATMKAIGKKRMEEIIKLIKEIHQN